MAAERTSGAPWPPRGLPAEPLDDVCDLHLPQLDLQALGEPPAASLRPPLAARAQAAVSGLALPFKYQGPLEHKPGSAVPLDLLLQWSIGISIQMSQSVSPPTSGRSGAPPGSARGQPPPGGHPQPRQCTSARWGRWRGARRRGLWGPGGPRRLRRRRRQKSSKNLQSGR